MKKIVTRMTHRALLMAGALSAALSQSVLHATPYASGIAVSGGNVSFYLNESGGTVVVTYEDSSTNSTFSGFGSGSTNLPSGQYTFSLGSHTSYNIAVTKTGTGIASLEPNTIQNTNSYTWATNHILQHWTAGRGLAVNANSASPYFGRVYVSQSNGAGQQDLYALNGDGSWVAAAGGSAGSAIGVTWSTDHDGGPYKLSIAANDMVIVTDETAGNSGVWMTDPNLTTNQLVLGPAGAASNHGEIMSRAWLVGDVNSPSGATVLAVDANYPNPPDNALLAYSNITASALSSGTGWQNAPDVVGGQIAINYDSYLGTGVYVYPGLFVGANHLIYGCEYRGGVSAGDPAGVTVYDFSFTNLLWSSHYNGGTSDYFNTASSGAAGAGGVCMPVDVAVSPDSKYLATVNFDGHFTVCSLTNGIPDVSTIYTIEPDKFGAAGSWALDDEIAWDAADNIYVLSYPNQGLKAWTLGLSSQAITSGNASGNTAFNMAFLNTAVNVYATNNPVISQANTHGNPTSGSFTLVRSGGNIGLPLTVNFKYTGTATNGTYTAGSTSAVVFAAGQTITNISIAAVTDSLPRPTTYLTLTVTPSSSYVLGATAATIEILNAATPYLMASVNQGSMYNAFSNDYASVTITRWGDTNSTETVSSYTLTGTATNGVHYTAPNSVTFNPGDLTQVVYVSPLINGALPTHNPNLPFTGNKSIVFGIGSGTGYIAAANTATLTIVDSASPPSTVLFADSLTDPNDVTNWGITAANGNLTGYPLDVNVAFGQDLTATPYYQIPFPPNGSQYALRETVNKSSGTGGNAPMTAVNAYLTNHLFGGNYAIRFNMNVIETGNFIETGFFNNEEGALFGFNHNGIETNWYGPDTFAPGAPSAFSADGIFFWVSDSGGRYDDAYLPYEAFAGNGSPTTNAGWALLGGQSSSSFTTAFKTNVFTSIASKLAGPNYNPGWTEGGPGLAANGSANYGLSVATWSDVEIKQLNGVVTMSIDKTPIFVYTNTTAFTNGYVMLGYEDPYNGGEDADAAVYYSNLRVVSIGGPVVSKVGLDNVHGNVVMNFGVTDDGGTFTVLSSPNVNGPYTSAAASVTSLSNGTFQVIVPQNGAKQFYKILQQ